MPFNGVITDWKWGKLILIIIGIILITVPVLTIRKCVESGTWPTTDGEIITSELLEKTSSGGQGSTSTDYRANIEFEYYVDGRRYVGGRVSYRWTDGPDSWTSRKGYCEDVLDRYPEGKRVKVHYDPDDPDDAVLETNPSWVMTALIIIGISILAFGVQPFYNPVKHLSEPTRSGESSRFVKKCPYCEGPAKYHRNKEKWGCPSCRRYVKPITERYNPDITECPQCGSGTEYSEEYDDYYCWNCEEYLDDMNVS